jgi:hypothetical protein
MRISNPDPNQKPNKALGYLFLFGIVFALGRCGVMGIYERTDPSGIAAREARERQELVDRRDSDQKFYNDRRKAEDEESTRKAREQFLKEYNYQKSRD